VGNSSAGPQLLQLHDYENEPSVVNPILPPTPLQPLVDGRICRRLPPSPDKNTPAGIAPAGVLPNA
jgi:hypothetical protein